MVRKIYRYRFLAWVFILLGLGFSPRRLVQASKISREEIPKQLSLNDAYRLAMRHNPTLAQMEARVDEARAERRRAWAQIKPTLSGAGTLTVSDPEVRIDSFGSAPLPEPITLTQRTQFGFSVTGTLPLFRGAAYQRIGAARKSVESARLRLRRARQDYALRVAQMYYDALNIKRIVSVVAQKVAVDEQTYAIAQSRVDAGVAVVSEASRAKLVLVQDRQQLQQQKIALAALKERLQILIGYPDTAEAGFELSEPAPQTTATGVEVSAEKISDQRADLRALKIDLMAAEQLEKAINWSFLPTLDVNANYRWQEVAGFAQRNSLAVVFSLGLSLYEGGMRYADRHRARAQRSQLRAAHEVLTRETAGAVARIRAEVAQAQSAMKTSEEALSLAQVTVNEMRARYESGAGTQLDLLDAQQRKLQASIDLTRARYARDLGHIVLAHALGRYKPLGARR